MAMKEKVLITGARGLIGQILAEDFAKDYELILIDKKEPANNVKQVDLSDFMGLKAALEGERLDAVIHLAGVLSAEGTWDNVLINNIIASRNIFEICKEMKVKRVIFASSNRVMAGWEADKSFNGLITEETAPNPLNFYGVSKLASEGLARVYWRDYSLPIFCLRIGSVRAFDDPKSEGANSRLMKTWLSKRDLVQLVRLCLEKKNSSFSIYNAFSNNKECLYSIEKAKRELGYRPQDGAG